jgi:hypothetical protein
MTSSRRCAKELLAQHRVAAVHVVAQLADLAAEGATTRMPENVSPTRPSISSASLRTER